MRAAVLHETGGPEVLELEEVPPPEPGEGQVLVRVCAASVNPIDWKFRAGLIPKQLPAVLGNDISGIVESSRADGFSAGDEVFGIAASGGYAELAAAAAAMLARKPAGLSHEQAAAIPVAGMTAWQALFDRAQLAPSQTALIAGAAGGVGHFAVQLARHAGARVIGIGSTRNRDFVLGLGADEYIDYTQQDVAEQARGADVAFDTVGGDARLPLLAAVRDGGVLVTIVSGPPEPGVDGDRGPRFELLVMSPDSQQLSRIAELIVAGEIRVEIAQTLALSDVRRAHELSESGHTRGKLILTL